MNIKIPDYILYVIDKLETAGYEAFIVGGCVRDEILGLVPNDYDVTTSATTDEMKVVFRGDRVIETGIKHGTLTVLSSGNPVEITTYRLDGDYEDHRHPDSVTFTRNIEEDLNRRDFTINAMAYSPKRGLVDLHNGINDLKYGIIKTVGNPEDRFKEDALRILRGVRFAARFNFDIDFATLKAMDALCNDVQLVSKERVFKELCGLLVAGSVGLEKALTKCSKVIFAVIPELADSYLCEQITKYHKYDVWTHTIKSTAFIENDVELRFAMLLHDVAKPKVKLFDQDGHTSFKTHEAVGTEMAFDILTRLKAPNKFKENVCKFIKNHEFFRKDEINSYVVGKLIAEMGSIEETERLVKIFRADVSSKSIIAIEKNMPSIDKIATEIYNYKLNNKCFKVSDLKITGNDLIDVGAEKGKVLGDTLSLLLDMVMREEIVNEKSELLLAGKNILRKG